MTTKMIDLIVASSIISTIIYLSSPSLLFIIASSFGLTPSIASACLIIASTLAIATVALSFYNRYTAFARHCDHPTKPENLDTPRAMKFTGLCDKLTSAEKPPKTNGEIVNKKRKLRPYSSPKRKGVRPTQRIGTSNSST